MHERGGNAYEVLVVRPRGKRQHGRTRLDVMILIFKE